MAFDYSAIQSIALAQIEDKGRDITYRTVTSGTFNPATGANTGASSSDATIKAVFTNVLEDTVDGDIVRRSDKVVIVSASDVTPTKQDKIVDGSDVYQIINIDEIKPGDTALIYKLQVRR